MSPTLLLGLSMLSLLAGVAMHRAARLGRLALSAADGFVLFAIGGLLFLHVLPETIHIGGWAAAIAAVVGMVLPYLFERSVGGKPANLLSKAVIALAVIALCVHVFVDGAAIAGAGGHAGHAHGHEGAGAHEGSNALGLAVVLHRFPVGLALWWFVRPSKGIRDVALIVGVILVATLGGFIAGDVVLSAVPETVVGVFQALVAGSLLHVVLEHPRLDASDGHEEEIPSTPFERMAGAAGAIGALAFVFWLQGPEFAGRSEFLRLLVKVAPYLVVGYLLAGVFHAFLPPNWLPFMRRGHLATRPIRGFVLGLMQPVSTCSARQSYESLVAHGVAPAGATSFLLTVPVFSVPVLAVSFALLGVEMTALRLVTSAGLALAVGYVFGVTRASSAVPGGEHAHWDDPHASETTTKRLRDGLKFGLGEVVDHTGPWMLLGLAVAAAMVGRVFDISPTLQIVIGAVAGIPIYLGGAGMTPVAAVAMFALGVSPGAVLAFLLVGPALSMTTLGLYRKQFGTVWAAVFALLILAVAMAIGFAANSYFGDLASWASPLPLGDTAPPTWIGWIAVAVLVALYAASFVRQGPRQFLNAAFSLHGPEGHGHTHGDVHTHLTDTHTLAHPHAHHDHEHPRK